MTQTLPGEPYPDAISCVWNGLVVAGVDGYYAATDVYVYYGPTGLQLATLDSSSQSGYRDLLVDGLAVSGDGTRMLTLVATSPGIYQGFELRLQTLPAPP